MGIFVLVLIIAVAALGLVLVNWVIDFLDDYKNNR